MKYRKKPVIIDAEQYTEYGKLVKGMCNSRSCYTSGNNHPHVHTIHGGQIVNLEVGDWIIPEPGGVHFYPCKPDIFAATYEAVEDAKAELDRKTALYDRVSDDFAGEVGRLKAELEKLRELFVEWWTVDDNSTYFNKAVQADEVLSEMVKTALERGRQ